PRPTNRRHDRAWVRAVVTVEQYRFAHDITDARTLIGQRPENPIDHLDWLAVADTVKDARRALGVQPQRSPQAERPIGRATPTYEYSPPMRAGPSLDIGF